MGSTTHTVAGIQAGSRLDIFLTLKHPELTRSRIKKLIGSGHVLINGRKSKPGTFLQPGWEVSITVPPPEPSTLAPEEIPLNVVFEDSDLIVIDKPPHMVVHPSPGHSGGTLVNALLSHCGDLSGVGGVARPGIVHRLDIGTSGVIVAAKNDRTHVSLARQFKDHTIDRVYSAAVRGEVRVDSGRIEKPLGRSGKDRKKIAVVEGGRRAVTDFSVIARRQGISLLELSPATGRTHQLRVHMASAGHPILADSTYGGGIQGLHMKDPAALTLLKALKRPALHALKLGFSHPSTGRKMIFQAPPPEDLAALFNWILGACNKSPTGS